MNTIEERFFQATLAEDGQPIAAGFVPPGVDSSPGANERLLAAAQAEDGLLVSAASTNAVPINESLTPEFGKEKGAS